MIDTDGMIRTVAGTGREGAIATQSDIFHPSQIAVDPQGNLYIAGQDRISRVDASGTIRTFGGPSPTAGGGLTLGPRAVAVDLQGAVYYTRRDFSGISKVDVSGAVSSVLDIPMDEYSPEGLAVGVSGTLFFSDPRSNRVYEVQPGGGPAVIAGLGFGRYTGEGGRATDAKLQFPQSVAVDRLGNLYLQDGLLIRKVDLLGTIRTVAGNESTAPGEDVQPIALREPTGVTLDAAGNIYFSERLGHKIRKIDLTGSISIVAGGTESGFAGDGGPADTAQLAFPDGLAVDSAENVFVTDSLNHRIRKIDTSGVIRTVAGTGLPLEEPVSNGDGGPAASALLIAPAGLAVDVDANVYVTDGYGESIRKLTAVPALQPVAARIVNSASHLQGAAPEALMTLEGSDLGPGRRTLQSDPLPTAMLGTSVSVTGSDGVSRAAGLKLVTPDRVNFVVPAETPTGAASVSVSVPGASSESLEISVGGTAPGLFSANLSGAGVAAAEILRVAPDGTETREPAFARDPETGTYAAVALGLGGDEDQAFLVLCGTGMRRAAASSAQIGGEAVSIRAISPQPGSAGVDLVEAGPLPRSLAGRGEVTVTVTADGVRSNEVTVEFQ